MLESGVVVRNVDDGAGKGETMIYPSGLVYKLSEAVKTYYTCPSYAQVFLCPSAPEAWMYG